MRIALNPEPLTTKLETEGTTAWHACSSPPSSFLAPRLRPGHPGIWPGILEKARGQTVYWNAWAGDENTNAFIAWVAGRLKELHGINLTHVKITLTSEAVSRVVAEKAAGRHSGGSIDLIWINGENFLSMKEQGLLFGPFTQKLPNFALVDTVGKPTTVIDFTVPVDGLESPWRMAQVVYAYDSARLKNPPRSIPAMLAWARQNPGRITHPRIRNFLGSTFLKQALYELVEDPEGFAPAGGEHRFHAANGAALGLVRRAQTAACGARANSFRRPAPPCANCWRTARSTS